MRGSTWTWLCGRCVSSSLNCFLGAGVSQRRQVSLWAHLPFPLTPFLSSPSCDLLPEEPQKQVQVFRTRSQLSLFPAGLLCFQCSHRVMEIMATYKLKYLGKHEWNPCFPSSPGLMKGWQRSAPNLRWRNSRTDLSLLSTPSSMPVPEPSSVGNFNPTSGLNANLISRANVGFSTSIPHLSSDSVETSLTKVSSFLFFFHWISDFWYEWSLFLIWWTSELFFWVMHTQ